MDNWKVTMRHAGRRMTVHFSMGRGHNRREPTATDVLDCLASESAGVENARGDFKEWCGWYGYDTYTRRAERTFKQCQRQAEKLKTFLGELYETLLWECDRE